MINILVTGCNGQLGHEIRKISGSYEDYRFFLTDVDELDITDLAAVKNYVKSNRINCIVNAAAYTAVDRAEEEPEKANLINGYAVGNLAVAAKEAGALLVHISTDYVFDGTNHRPISEDEKPAPVSAYAASKYLGETELIEKAGQGVILRTSWLYSEFGNNFVKSMIRYGRERDILKVVYDQVGSPTYAGDLAKLILDLIPLWLKNPRIVVYHYSNEGVASWYDFTLAIHDIAGIYCDVIPIETKDYPLPAKRPFYSLMAKDKIKSEFGIEIPYWRDSLKKCISTILGNEQK